MSSTTYAVEEETSIELIARLRAPVHSANVTRKSDGGKFIEAVEDALERCLTKKAQSQFLAKAGPFLLCLTFIDDGLRIALRWSEQHRYMVGAMHMWSWLASLVLIASAVTQLSSSWFILRPISFQPSRVKSGCYALLAFVVLQPFLYGQHLDLDFMCRSSTMAGGLLLLIMGENGKQDRQDGGLLGGHTADGRSADRLQLAGRLLLTFMFLFQAVFGKEGGLHSVIDSPSVLNVGSSGALLTLSLMVCLGFKAEWSSLVLTAVLGVANFALYPFWSADAHMSDYLRYYFFQTLSIMGGLMLLTLHGPGGLSLDGKKKGL